MHICVCLHTYVCEQRHKTCILIIVTDKRTSNIATCKRNGNFNGFQRPVYYSNSVGAISIYFASRSMSDRLNACTLLQHMRDTATHRRYYNACTYTGFFDTYKRPFVFLHFTAHHTSQYTQACFKSTYLFLLIL
jgi:hypothetical protein